MAENNYYVGYEHVNRPQSVFYMDDLKYPDLSINPIITTTQTESPTETKTNWWEGLGIQLPPTQSSVQTPTSQNTSSNDYSSVQVGSKSKNENIRQARDFFKNNGFGISAYGFIGNFLGESGMNHRAINQSEKKAGMKGYGVGIAQWSNGRKNDFKRAMGIDPEQADLNTQLQYVLQEVNQRKPLVQKLKQIDSDFNSGKLSRDQAVEQATSAVLLGYENGSNAGLITPEKFNSIYVKNRYNGHDYNSHLKTRTKHALSAYID